MIEMFENARLIVVGGVAVTDIRLVCTCARNIVKIYRHNMQNLIQIVILLTMERNNLKPVLPA